MRRRLLSDLKTWLQRTLRLVTFRHVEARPPAFALATVLAILGIYVVVVLAYDLSVSGGRKLGFNEYGVSSMLAFWAVIAGLVAAWHAGKPSHLQQALCDLAGIFCITHMLIAAGYHLYLGTGLFDLWYDSTWVRWSWLAVGYGLMGLSLVWAWRSGRSLWQGERRWPGAAMAAAVLAAILIVPAQPTVYGDMTSWNREDVWHYARYVLVGDEDSGSEQEREAYVPNVTQVEDTLFRQPSLLNGTLGGMMPSDDARPEYFFLAAAPNGWQDVFANEVTKAKQIFDERFGTRGHSAVFITSAATLDTVPLANTKNLEVALMETGKLMDRENDVLVLFITSHGSQGVVSVSLDGYRLNQITPDFLANALDLAHIKNRVLIISACHSGSFIPRLQGPNTLIMAAARADRTSFGCANGRDWTYFGDALFNHALREETDFVKAFAKAKSLIEAWEFWRVLLLQKRSEPQISVGADIGKVLARIETSGKPREAASIIDGLRQQVNP